MADDAVEHRLLVLSSAPATSHDDVGMLARSAAAARAPLSEVNHPQTHSLRTGRRSRSRSAIRCSCSAIVARGPRELEKSVEAYRNASSYYTAAKGPRRIFPQWSRQISVACSARSAIARAMPKTGARRSSPTGQALAIRTRDKRARAVAVRAGPGGPTAQRDRQKVFRDGSHRGGGRRQPGAGRGDAARQHPAGWASCRTRSAMR